jgi:thiamine monophosphate kinase
MTEFDLNMKLLEQCDRYEKSLHELCRHVQHVTDISDLMVADLYRLKAKWASKAQRSESSLAMALGDLEALLDAVSARALIAAKDLGIDVDAARSARQQSAPSPTSGDSRTRA